VAAAMVAYGDAPVRGASTGARLTLGKGFFGIAPVRGDFIVHHLNPVAQAWS